MSKIRMIAVTLVAIVVMASRGSAGAAGGFDGDWNATVSCSTEGDVEGYVWKFPARVQNGHLSGKYVNPNDHDNYGILSGSIGAGGDATLLMTGRTGLPSYSVKHVARHSPIHYSANAHFDANRGFGKRIQQRPCDLTFSKG